MSKLFGFIGVGLLGLLLVIGGTILLILLPDIIDDRIRKELRLKNGTDAYDRWKEIPVPILMKFYFFELNNSKSYTNLDDIQLIERGPYVFEEHRTKEDILFGTTESNEPIASYRERRKYEFREDLSVGHYEDNLTIINLPLLGIIFNEIMTEGKMGFELYKDELDINEKSLFTTRTVGQILFDGINYKLFELLEPFVPKTSGISLKPFSIFNSRSDLGYQTSVYIDTNADNFGEIFRYNNKTELRNDDQDQTLIWPLHQTPYYSCDELRGNDGIRREPSVHKSDTIFVFEPKLCRPMFFKYMKTTEFKDIRTLRFVVPEDLYKSPLIYKPNSCYCLNDNLTQCNSNGGLIISHCLEVSRGAPVMVSTPYFLNGDDHFRDDIRLVPPKPLNTKNYGTYLDIEPMTGITLKAMKRIQISIRISNSDTIPQLNATKAGKDYVIPLLWLEETGELPDYLKDEMNRRLFTKKKLIVGGTISGIVLGTFLVMITSYLISKNFKPSC